MTKTLILFASSRNDGGTMKALSAVLNDRKLGDEIEFINLNEKNISYFDYDHKNIDDDFIEVAIKMTESDNIIFVTPVYWYMMSASLKTVFDRFTDLITIRKDLGRRLKNKKCFVICCGDDVNLPQGFEKPISETSKYLEMDYCGYFYYSTGEGISDNNQQDRAIEFGKKIFERE